MTLLGHILKWLGGSGSMHLFVVELVLREVLSLFSLPHWRNYHFAFLCPEWVFGLVEGFTIVRQYLLLVVVVNTWRHIGMSVLAAVVSF